MKSKIHSIRTFIGAKDYTESRAFYRELGFSENVISEDMSYFVMQEFGFYLQDYFVKDWLDNSMIFLEIDHLDEQLALFKELNLTRKYDNVRLSKIHYNDWGNEFFLHDPSGVLWHFGTFNK